MRLSIRTPKRAAQLALAFGAFSLVAGGSGIAAAATGKPAPKRAKITKTGAALPDFDKRFAGVRMLRTASQLQALRALGDVEVGWTKIGTPHSLRARTGALTKASSAAPDAIARAFMREHAAVFRQQPADVAGLELTMNHRDAASGATFLRYRQLDGGREVHGSSLLVVLDAKRRIQLVGGTLAPSLDGPAEAPAVSADEAVARVAASLSPRRLPPIQQAASQPDPDATLYRNTLALPRLRGAAPVKADLVTVPTATGGRTAWRVRAEVASNADYETLVDARSGDVIYRVNQWANSEPHGLVHTGDDPEAGGQVANVLFSGINGTWVAGNTTSGNNVNAYQDLPEDDTPNAGDQPVNADQHFDFTWTDPWGNTGVIPATGADRDAVVTQLFYYTNWFHDYAYNLGFTETARNFQEDNFGAGGSGGDAVFAESDDGYGNGTDMLCLDSDSNPILCRNNANFNVGGPDGSRPRMQMYVGEVDMGGGVTRRTQRAMNRDTVIHEYAHGITGRIISDGNLAGGVQSGALGEGWSDAFATSINNDPVYGEYNNGNYTTGIRGVAYDDDNLEYGDLCDNGPPNPCQVHDDGRIWAMAMWEQRTALIGKHGFAAGKAYHERVMMLGLFVTPDTPSYHDARTGYLGADALLDLFNQPNSGNRCLIWRVFADNELGVTASPDADDDQTPNVSTATPPECDPEASIAPTVSTPEGTAVNFDGTGSVANGDDGDTLTYAWEFDGDDDFNDSTSPTPTWTYGDNGSFTAKLRVTNTAGYTDEASTTVTITNVAPTVTIAAAQVTSVNENQALQVSANFSDPGWLDTYSGSVDPGTTFLATQAGTIAVTTQGPPQDLGTISATVTYGDNGTFTVVVSVTDDDGGTGSDSFNVTVANVDPTATIDETGAVLVNGVPTFFADEGVPIDFSARVQDPGSDDETWYWDWDDGSSSTAVKNRVDPTQDDPLPSPNVNPRDFTTAASHAWAGACMYDAVFNVTDDDGGSDSDTVKVLITGPPSLSRDAGYWQHQYRGNGKIDFTTARLECYLEIAAFLSNVFNEVRDASTIQKAHDDIFVAGLRGTLSEQLDRQLLTSWLNFANGGVEYTEMLDTDRNGSLDTAFVDAMATAEAVRLDAGATREQLEAQRDILGRINSRDRV